MLNELTTILKEWTDATGFPEESADELLYRDMSDVNRDWLEKFIEFWETCSNMEYELNQLAENKHVK